MASRVVPTRPIWPREIFPQFASSQQIVRGSGENGWKFATPESVRHIATWLPAFPPHEFHLFPGLRSSAFRPTFFHSRSFFRPQSMREFQYPGHGARIYEIFNCFQPEWGEKTFQFSRALPEWELLTTCVRRRRLWNCPSCLPSRASPGSIIIASFECQRNIPPALLSLYCTTWYFWRD